MGTHGLIWLRKGLGRALLNAVMGSSFIKCGTFINQISFSSRTALHGASDSVC